MFGAAFGQRQLGPIIWLQCCFLLLLIIVPPHQIVELSSFERFQVWYLHQHICEESFQYLLAWINTFPIFGYNELDEVLLYICCD